MTTGVQFTGTLDRNATQKWFTFNWNPGAAHHLDRRADDGQERRAGDSMVRRCRTGDPDNLHLLDHGDQSDQCQHYF